MTPSAPHALVPPLPSVTDDARILMRREVWLLAAVIAAATIVSLVRIPSAAFHVVWAEDGARFLVDAITPSTSGQLLLPYDGYLHLLPRLLAEAITGVVPLAGFAVAVSASTAAVTGLVAGGVFWFSRSVMPWLPARLTVALLTVLTPLGAVEVLGNLANLHWYLLWLTPWLLLYRPRTHGGAVTAGVLAVVLALTEPQSAVFAPLLLVGLRDRRRWPLIGGLAVGLAAQLAATLSAPRPVRPGAFAGIDDVAGNYLLDVPLTLLTGSADAIAWVARSTGWVGPIAVFVVILAAAAFVLVRGTAAERIGTMTCLVGSVVLWSGGYLLNVRWTGTGPEPAWPASFQLYRYGFVPGLLLAAVVVLAACILRRTAVVRRRGGIGAGPVLAVTLCVALLGTVAVGSTFSRSLRSAGVSWSGQIDEADVACDTLPASERRPIEISPEGWSVALACTVLEQD
jgi:hypothetical protein